MNKKFLISIFTGRKPNPKRPGRFTLTGKNRTQHGEATTPERAVFDICGAVGVSNRLCSVENEIGSTDHLYAFQTNISGDWLLALVTEVE